jgi:hypothetical protein
MNSTVVVDFVELCALFVRIDLRILLTRLKEDGRAVTLQL